MTATILVSYDPNLLSPNNRYHWAEKALKIKRARMLAKAAWLHAGAPRFTVPVTCKITICRGRMIDADNALAACKALIDGIFGGNATPDDSAKWVSFAPVEVISDKQFKASPRVMFEISERGV